MSLSTVLSHPTFLTNFIATNRVRLIEAYDICTQFLRAYSIPYIPSNAGFFIWADLTAYLHLFEGTTPLERERAMNNALLDGGIHLATAEAFYGEDNGWFRITFSVDKETLILGLKRY